jgi:hypothetical protein
VGGGWGEAAGELLQRGRDDAHCRRPELGPISTAMPKATAPASWHCPRLHPRHCQQPTVAQLPLSKSSQVMAMG